MINLDTPSIGREYYDRYEDVEDDDKLYMFLQSIKRGLYSRRGS